MALLGQHFLLDWLDWAYLHCFSEQGAYYLLHVLGV
jgi:hypothetical protein